MVEHTTEYYDVLEDEPDPRLAKSIRRLKTPNSKRTLPLVGYAKVAMKLALKQADEKYIYPRYLKDGTCRATHASAALGKWLKKDFGLLPTAYGTLSGIVSEPLGAHW